MNIENGIADGSVVANCFQELLSLLPQLSVGQVSQYLSYSKPTSESDHLATDIINHRFTFVGMKNYVHCLCNIDIVNIDGSTTRGIDVFVDTIIYQINLRDLKPKEKLYLFLTLLYCATLVTIIGSSSKAASIEWVAFNDRTWIRRDISLVKSCAIERLVALNFCSRVGIVVSDATMFYVESLKRLSSSMLVTFLSVQDYVSRCNKKDTVFTMPNCCLDYRYLIIRRPLPGDWSTFSGCQNPDVGAWSINRQDMMLELLKWMSDSEIVEDYLTILSQALFSFESRYSIVNRGSGSDGKSTWLAIIVNIFGTYSAAMPSIGPRLDSRNSNDATPVTNKLFRKRLAYGSDVQDIESVISSPGFKALSGGDNIYRRGLNKEAEESDETLKLLVIMNTNSENNVFTRAAEITRVKVVPFLHKMITEEDKELIPLHQTAGSAVGIPKYETKFIEKYGPTLMLELIIRHRDVRRKLLSTRLSKKMIANTKAAISPRTILIFMNDCTEDDHTESESSKDFDSRMRACIPGYDQSMFTIEDDKSLDGVSVEQLYTVFLNWKREGHRFTRSDPNNIEEFTSHLAFYYTLEKKMYSKTRGEQLYIKNIKIKGSNQVQFSSGFRTSIVHPSMLSLQGSGVGNTLVAPPRTVSTLFVPTRQIES